MKYKYLLTIIPITLILTSSAFASNGSKLVYEPRSSDSSNSGETFSFDPKTVVNSEMSYGETELSPISEDPIAFPEFSISGQEPENTPVTQFASASVKNSRTHGKIVSVFRYKNQLPSQECSGTVIRGSGGKPIVATAAHCVFLWRLPKIGRIPIRKAIRVDFVPAYKMSGKSDKAPFGVYQVTGIQVKNNIGSYLTGDKTGSFAASYDWAFLSINKTKKIKKEVGTDGIVFNSNLINKSSKIIGYPGSDYMPPYGAIKSWCEAAKIVALDKNQPRPKPYLSTCPILGGMSGGGWRDVKQPKILSISSYITKFKGRIHSGGVRLEDAPRNPSGPYLDYLQASRR